MPDWSQGTAQAIRIYEDHARAAAVTSKKSPGQWMEESIREKLTREGTTSK